MTSQVGQAKSRKSLTGEMRMETHGAGPVSRGKKRKNNRKERTFLRISTCGEVQGQGLGTPTGPRCNGTSVNQPPHILDSRLLIQTFEKLEWELE